MTRKRIAPATGLSQPSAGPRGAGCDGGVAGDGRPAEPLDSPGVRTNVVPRRTRLIGRERELRDLGDAFASGARLVTLTGPGGVGKTRLAQELALADAARWDEAWLCDLSHATDLDGVCAAVADALEVALSGGRPEQQLARALAARPRTLVVLDNFEQVTEIASGAVAAWMRVEAGARLLVTSREPLHLGDELVLGIEPLSPGSEAVLLLADRLGPSADSAPRDAELLAAIAARLDGIPLALELAAPRIAILGAAEVLARLERGLEVLAGGPRDVAARQRTMGRAVSWSWDLLDPREQAVLLQVCTFRGGFSVSAVEAVAAPAPEPGAPSLIDVVESLRNKSLLRGVPGGPDGSPRFEAYGVVRAHLADRVAALPAEVQRRHARFFAQWGESQAAELDGADAARALRGLALERENLLAAIQWASQEEGDPVLALRLALVLGRLTWIRGPLALQVRVLDQVLGGAERTGAVALHGRALLARGNALRRLGELARGRADLEAALELCRRATDPGLEGEVLTDLGALAIQEARLDVALADVGHAIALLSPLAEPARLAGAHAIAANALHHCGKLEPAAAAYEQALALYRRAGHRRGEAFILTALAALRLEVGRNDEAIELAQRAAELQRGDRWQAYSRSTLAQARLDAGDLAAARVEYDEAARLALEGGDPYLAAVCLGFGGVAECLAGDTARGAELLGKSVGQLEWGMAGSVLTGFWAAALASLGRLEQARELLDRAERELTEGGGVLLLEAVRLHRGILELALARHADQVPDPETARALRQRAAARAGAVTVGSGAEPPLTKRSVEVRLALALLERALGTHDGPAPKALLVHASGAWFTTLAGARVDCSRRPLHRRLLAALARRRLEAPGEPISSQELLEIAWPGERILPRAARNRLYVALSRLRTLGLEDVLQSAGAGYLLDPAVPVRLVHDP